MPRQVLFLANDPTAPVGLLGEVFAESGFDISTFDVVAPDRPDDPVVDVSFPDPLDYDVIVPLGARWAVYDERVPWIADEMDLVRRGLDAGVGVLGVCFGGQLLAAALGGTVARSPQPEIGWCDVHSDNPALVPPGPVRLQQLADLPLVLPSTRHGLRTLLVQSLNKAGLALQPRLELDSMAGCLNLVKIARYATILPHGSIGESCRRRGVSVHEIVDPQILRTVSLARLRSRTCRPAEAAFLDELRLAFTAPHPAAIAATSRDFYGPARQFT